MVTIFNMIAVPCFVYQVVLSPSFHHCDIFKICAFTFLNVIHQSLPRGLWDFLVTVFINLGKQGEW